MIPKDARNALFQFFRANISYCTDATLVSSRLGLRNLSDDIALQKWLPHFSHKWKKRRRGRKMSGCRRRNLFAGKGKKYQKEIGGSLVILFLEGWRQKFLLFCCFDICVLFAAEGITRRQTILINLDKGMVNTCRWRWRYGYL